MDESEGDDGIPEDQQAMGMSNGALYTIGAVCALFSVYMVYQASSGLMASSTGGYMFGGVLAVGAVGCFAKGKLQGAALRAMGGVVLLACIGYVVSQFASGEVVGEGRSDTSLMNAIKCFVIFGIPAGYLMARGPKVFDLPTGRVRDEG
jgi:hypothetical protein